MRANMLHRWPQVPSRLSLLALPLWVFGCGATTSTYVEGTAKSPSGRYEAVLVTRSGGGAAGWLYHEVLLRDGDSRSLGDLTVRLSHLDEPSCRVDKLLRWHDDDTLLIKFHRASVSAYSNTWWSPLTGWKEDKPRAILIVLDPYDPLFQLP